MDTLPNAPLTIRTASNHQLESHTDNGGPALDLLSPMLPNDGGVGGIWPRTWEAHASWSARDPAVAGSLTDSFMRTARPTWDVIEGATRSPLRHQVHTAPSTPPVGELDEQLLYDYQEEGAEAASPLLGRLRGQAAAAAAAAEAEAGEAAWRAVRHDAAGTHVRTESFNMHIVEERASSNSWHTAFNACNVLCGVGLLTTPYALAISGVGSLLLLLAIGGIACLTGRMLAACMAATPRDAVPKARPPGAPHPPPGALPLRSYPDIGGAAFGHAGRLTVSVLLYLELFCCCVDFLILEADNLAALFPGVALELGGVQLSAHQTMLLLAALVVLPTVWLRDMSLLSYVSVGGIFASLALIGLVAWSGVASVGFPHSHPPLVTWSGVPVAIGLYSFCFSGHAVFPSLYASMRDRTAFPRILAVAFVFVLALYASMALLGATMFGPTISDNISLDLQAAAPHALPTHVTMWLVVINPLSKLGLTLAPVAMSIEEVLPVAPGSSTFTVASLLLRTALLAAVVVVAALVPFFSLVMTFIGAFMSMSISIVLPCVFYLRLCGHTIGMPEATATAAIAAFGVAAGVMATSHAVAEIAGKY